jgi:hypothetical protein
VGRSACRPSSLSDPIKEVLGCFRIGLLIGTVTNKITGPLHRGLRFQFELVFA